MSTPTIALVGCGAIADFFHLPALARRPDLVQNLILVDPDVDRAREIRAKLGAADAVSDHRDVLSRVQGAIVATPHHLHHPITIDFIREGVHVLCEKPLADTPGQVDEIVRAAEQSGVTVSVNHTRRLFSSFQEIKRLLASGALGEVQQIEYELGEPFEWPAATDAYFGTKARGRGVLFDTGAHIVDLVCWWLGGEPEIVEYVDDSHGGTEAVASMVLRRGPTTARIHLSWLSKLRNEYRIVGSNGVVGGGAYEWSSYRRIGPNRRSRKIKTGPARTFDDFSDALLSNFTEVMSGRAKPITSAADARPSIAVIDACYARRMQIDEPWHNACRELTHV